MTRPLLSTRSRLPTAAVKYGTSPREQILLLGGDHPLQLRVAGGPEPEGGPNTKPRSAAVAKARGVVTPPEEERVLLGPSKDMTHPVGAERMERPVWCQEVVPNPEGEPVGVRETGHDLADVIGCLHRAPTEVGDVLVAGQLDLLVDHPHGVGVAVAHPGRVPGDAWPGDVRETAHIDSGQRAVAGARGRSMVPRTRSRQTSWSTLAAPPSVLGRAWNIVDKVHQHRVLPCRDQVLGMHVRAVQQVEHEQQSALPPVERLDLR